MSNNVCVYIEQHASSAATKSFLKTFEEKYFSKLIVAHGEFQPSAVMQVFSDLGERIIQIELPAECDWVGEAMRTIAPQLAEIITADENCLVITSHGQASLELPLYLLFSAMSDYDIVFSRFARLSNPNFYERCGIFDGAIYCGDVVQAPLFQMFWANLGKNLSDVDQLYAQRYFFDEFHKHFRVQTLFEVEPSEGSVKL